MLREKAYKLVQGYAMCAWEEESDFRAAIEGDAEILAALGMDGIARSFSLERQLRHVEQIFARVFGDNPK
jgi:adenylosuccinate lyase